MQAGTAEERIEGVVGGTPQDLDSLLDSSLVAANEASGETSKIEETAMTDPEDLEVEEKKMKRTAKKPTGRPRISTAKPMKPTTKTKRAHSNGDAKASLAINEGTKALVRKLRAKMEFESGERISFSAALTAAIEKALE